MDPKQPGVRAGKPCIDSTRITVLDIVALLKAGRFLLYTDADIHIKPRR